MRKPSVFPKGRGEYLRVGGKNASLGELLSQLTSAGIRVPDGFATTAEAFRIFLKESGLNSYDEFQLLLLNEGRCSQDDYYIKEISPDDLPKEFWARLQYKVEDVIPLAGKSLLVFFRNGLIKRCELQPRLAADIAFSPLLKNDAYFSEVGIQVGGYGVCWGDQLTISDRTLYETGKVIPLSQEDFVTFVQQRIVTSAEAAELLQCSKQNIDDLIRRGKLHPIRTSPKSKLFLKSEILQRLWK